MWLQADIGPSRLVRLIESIIGRYICKRCDAEVLLPKVIKRWFVEYTIVIEGIIVVARSELYTRLGPPLMVYVCLKKHVWL